MSFNPITRRIRHLQRYAQVLEVLARHGFADLSQQLGLDSLLDRARTAVGGASGTETTGANERVPVAVRLRTMLEELGPTYVKLGQVLSTRPDLVPPEWVEEFKKLQNNVPGVEFAVIEKMLEDEFPERRKRLFRTFQHQPLAAGSMAQIHRATLRDGTRIVLKFLRPGIKEIIAVDMEILHALAELVENHFANLGYSPTEIVREFTKELSRETDMMQEGRATERLRGLFADDSEVVFPAVHWEATTHNVLALDEIDGLSFANLDAAALGRDDRRTLVENGARAVFRQCLEFGFFHADPHPGNLMALPGGRIAFIDCGMTGEIDARTSRQLADLVSGVAAGDLDRVIASAGAITDMDQAKLEDRALRADVNAIVSAFRDTPLERLNLGKVLQDFFASLRTHRVRCPADIILLIKSLTTIESIAHELDPSFEMVPFVRPFLENLIAKRYGVSAMKSRVQRGLRQYIELFEELPGELRPILSQLRKNKLAVNLEHRGLDRVTHTIEHASRNISLALIIAAMFVGSSILVHAASHAGSTPLAVVGYVGFATAVIMVVVMIVSNRRNRGD